MIRKILGIAIIAGAIFGVIFLIKFIPVYLGVSELEKALPECISNFQQYREKGCRDYFQSIIDRNNLNITAEEIQIHAAVQRQSFVDVEFEQDIDFFGAWTYTYHSHLRHEGRVPDRM